MSIEEVNDVYNDTYYLQDRSKHDSTHGELFSSAAAETETVVGTLLRPAYDRELLELAALLSPLELELLLPPKRLDFFEVFDLARMDWRVSRAMERATEARSIGRLRSREDADDAEAVEARADVALPEASTTCFPEVHKVPSWWVHCTKGGGFAKKSKTERQANEDGGKETNEEIVV